MNINNAVRLAYSIPYLNTEKIRQCPLSPKLTATEFCK